MHRSFVTTSFFLFVVAAGCEKRPNPEQSEAATVPSGSASGSQMPKTVVLATDPEASTAKFLSEGGASATDANVTDAGASDR